MRRFVRFALVSLSACSLALAAGGDGRLRYAAPVRVMTQNLYVGVDVFRIGEARTPEELPFVVAELYDVFRSTRFAERADAIAAEVAEFGPEVVGLQEVYEITRLSPGEPPELEVTDFLAVLLAALEERDAHYVVAAHIENADVELPIATPTGLGLVRVIDGEALLVRDDVAFADAAGTHYSVNLEVPVGDPPYAFVEFLRGFVAADVEVRGRAYRVVSTHLETRGADLGPMVPFIQAAQAQELIATLSGETLPVILVGDLNASPSDPVSPPLVPPYAQFVASGFVDLWTLHRGLPDPGFTCCQEEDLSNPVSLLDERIDYVFVRDDAGFVGPTAIRLVGNEPADRTASGLWPSDHAGLSAQIHVPWTKPPHGRRR